MPIIYRNEETVSENPTLFQRRPVAVIAAFTALINTIVAGLAYNQGWSGEATALILGVVVAASTAASALWAQTKVSPV